MLGTFLSDPLRSVWGHSVQLTNSDVKIFKRLLFPRFSSNFNQTLHTVQKSGGNRGYKCITCSAICQILKTDGTN